MRKVRELSNIRWKGKSRLRYVWYNLGKASKIEVNVMMSLVHRSIFRDSDPRMEYLQPPLLKAIR